MKGFPFQEPPVTQCFDCGSVLCESHTETCGICNGIFCPPCRFLHRGRHSKPRTRGTSRTKKGLKLLQTLGLFPISEGHKLIQNFLQSLEPPFLVCGCPSISPVHLRAVRFTDLGYFFPKFLDTL